MDYGEKIVSIFLIWVKRNYLMHHIFAPRDTTTSRMSSPLPRAAISAATSFSQNDIFWIEWKHERSTHTFRLESSAITSLRKRHLSGESATYPCRSLSDTPFRPNFADDLHFLITGRRFSTPAYMRFAALSCSRNSIALNLALRRLSQGKEGNL